MCRSAVDGLTSTVCFIADRIVGIECANCAKSAMSVPMHVGYATRNEPWFNLAYFLLIQVVKQLAGACPLQRTIQPELAQFGLSRNAPPPSLRGPHSRVCWSSGKSITFGICLPCTCRRVLAIDFMLLQEGSHDPRSSKRRMKKN